MHFSGSEPTVDLTYSDVFLVPRRSGVTSRLDVDLSPGDGTSATIPLVASNMNSVTGPRLAATLARRGGIGVLPQDMPLQQLDEAIRWVKRQPVSWDSPLVLSPLATVEDALRYEIRRQGALLSAGGAVTQETRHWNEQGWTSPGRSKEQAEDYRYFPEPDLVPVAPSAAWVEELRATLPEPPAQRRTRLQADWGFTDLEMRDVVGTAGSLDLIDATVAAGASASSARKWWLGELARRANESGSDLAGLPITPAQVARVQELVEAGTLSDKLARSALEGVLAGEGGPDAVVAARGLAVVSDDAALGQAVDAVIAAQPEVADKIRDGKVQAAGALIGAVMKAMRGQADAARVRELILQRLA